MESLSREYAKFKRTFVGPKLTRVLRKKINYKSTLDFFNFDIVLSDIIPATKKYNAKIWAPWPNVPQEDKNPFMLEFEKQTIIKKGKQFADASRRRKKVKQATPKWCDLKEIENIYIQCQNLSILTGIPHEVDHIIPIAGKLVCGLHVESNLQILPESENRQKSNIFDIN